MKSLILGRLKYNGEKKLLVNNQNVDDIIDQLLKHHEAYKSEYDKISSFFIRDNEEKTLKCIFDFLKDHVNYVVETTENQKLKSPAGIIHTGKTTGSDCKNYSLFTNGIIDSLNRKKVFNIPFCYRFSSYKLLDTVPQHVFAVAYPNTKKEIWIDAVLPSFNERKSYTYKIDKKPMALYSVSGVGCCGSTIGRRKTKAERKAKRTEKRGKRRSGENCTGRALNKYNPVLVSGRKAFLLLVRLNVRGLGKKLYVALSNPQTRIKTLEQWCKLGGKAEVLKETVNKVERKLRSRGKIAGGLKLGLEEEGYIGVAIETIIATATPILTAMSKILKAGSRLLPEGSKARQILETGADVSSDVSEAGESFSDNQETE